MIEKTATIRNGHGIHCRPSAVIVKHVEPYEGTVRVEAGTGSSDCRQILGLISLGLDHGSQVRICVDGPGEEAFCDELVELFERIFDFPPREPGKPVNYNGIA